MSRVWKISQLVVWSAIITSVVNVYTWHSSVVAAVVWAVILAYWVHTGFQLRALRRRRHEIDEMYFVRKLLDYYSKPDGRPTTVLLPEESPHDHPQ